VREYRTFSNPAAITREDEVYLKTRTLDSDLNEIALETLTHYFDALNRPTGYLRQVSSLLPDPSTDDAARILQPSLEESQRITYGVHPLNAARDVQQMVETQVSGLILVDEENQYLGKPYKIPLHDAHKSGLCRGRLGANDDLRRAAHDHRNPLCKAGKSCASVGLSITSQALKSRP
jgi:hypothetical protein